MSSSSDRTPQPDNAPSSEPSSLAQPSQEAIAPTAAAPTTSGSEAQSAPPVGDADSPVLRKPPARPVRPQPPAEPPKPPVAATPKVVSVVKQEIVSVSSAPAPAPAPAEVTASPLDAAALRQQPIPPPSEPKQYRAIGLVEGLYTPAGEEFTIGELKTADGTILKAVLLGRVMSLVKNHIDLAKEHLWVVYPRTREEEKELHIQIVGIWEPETLKKEEEEGDAGESTTAEANTAEADTATAEGFADPRLGDGYFSVRGEVVYYSEEEQHLVVKIQQSPRKNTQKAKAFKLSLRGTLPSPKTVGYFWDLHTKREDNSLVVTESVCIGLAPPKKRGKGELPRGGRKPSFGRGRPPGRPQRPGAAGSPRPSWEGSSKPIKRSEQPSEG